MEYWIVVNDTHAGPYTAEQLRGSITPDTYVWYRDLPQWVLAKDVPELAALFEAPAPAPAPEPEPVAEEPKYYEPEVIVSETLIETTEPIVEDSSNTYQEETVEETNSWNNTVSATESVVDEAIKEEVVNEAIAQEQMAAEEVINEVVDNIDNGYVPTKEKLSDIIADYKEPETETEAPQKEITVEVEEKVEYSTTENETQHVSNNPSSSAWWNNLAQAEAEAEAEAEVNSRHNLTCPPRYLAWAIITTLIFCLPLGIVAIVFSSKVRRLYNSGDYEGAVRASERTAWWSNVAFVVGLMWLPFQIVFSMLTA